MPDESDSPPIKPDPTPGHAEYAQYVVGLVGAADVATRAMCIVAHENLRPMVLAFEAVSAKTGKAFGLDEMIEDMRRRFNEVGDDPVQSRRYAWFLMAAHVTRLDQLAANDASLTEHAVEVWLQLADAGRLIQRVLRHNIVWKREEKVWFDTLETERDGIRHVVTLVMPKPYRRHARAKLFAERHGFLLLP